MMVLNYGVEAEHVSVFPLLSDSSLIIFKFTITNSSTLSSHHTLSPAEFDSVTEGAAASL